ncbi:MAG: carboxylate--amine ligase, partial [Gammaproteobacteria bacterium]|nr:carboxylate--amine ligase [Gammaproteobacteria bacterium]
NTDIYETFRAMADALRDHFHNVAPQPLYVVVGRGGPNLIRGMGYLRDTLDGLGLPYQMFGYDSAMSEVVNFAQAVDKWMKAGGRAMVARAMGIS